MNLNLMATLKRSEAFGNQLMSKNVGMTTIQYPLTCFELKQRFNCYNVCAIKFVFNKRNALFDQHSEALMDNGRNTIQFTKNES